MVISSGHTNQMVGVVKQRLASQAAQTGLATPIRRPLTAPKAGEALMPIYDGSGEVVAYERSMAPEKLQALKRNTHLGEMVGAWSGRQAEEELAQGFNRKLVDRLWEAWDKGKKEGRKGEFVNLADSDLKDPVYQEAMKLVPAEMRDYISEKFGDAGFMIRKDMVNNAVGYRAASVSDAWTELSRVDEKTRQAFVDTATAVMGKNAFPWLVRAEKFWQAGISVAKNTIVIRSVIVPMSNLGSNFLQLTTLGVPARDIAEGFSSKLVEIDRNRPVGTAVRRRVREGRRSSSRGEARRVSGSGGR